MNACATLEMSTMPAATKPRMKPSPQNPCQVHSSPPSPSSNQHGGGKTGGLRGRKTSIRTQRLTGGTPPFSSSTLGRQSTGPRAPLFVWLQSSYVPAGGTNTHDVQRQGTHRAHLARGHNCLFVCVKAFNVSLCVC